jgi:hypothetical protein
LKRKWYHTKLIFIVVRNERFNHCHYSMNCPYNTDIDAIFDAREDAQAYLICVKFKYPREEFEMIVYERNSKEIHHKEFSEIFRYNWGFTRITQSILILMRFLFLFYELTRQEVRCRRGFLMVIHGRIEDSRNNLHCNPNGNSDCYNCRTGN